MKKPPSLQRCYTEIELWQKRLNRAMRRAYPVGDKIRYAWGLGERTAVVIGHSGPGHHQQLVVTGVTGKEYTVDVRSVISLGRP